MLVVCSEFPVVDVHLAMDQLWHQTDDEGAISVCVGRYDVCAGISGVILAENML